MILPGDVWASVCLIVVCLLLPIQLLQLELYVTDLVQGLDLFKVSLQTRVLYIG